MLTDIPSRIQIFVDPAILFEKHFFRWVLQSDEIKYWFWEKAGDYSFCFVEYDCGGPSYRDLIVDNEIYYDLIMIYRDAKSLFYENFNLNAYFYLPPEHIDISGHSNVVYHDGTFDTFRYMVESGLLFE